MHRVTFRFLLLLLLTTLSLPRPSTGQAAATPMRNADVIALIQAGVSDDIIIAKIEAAPSTAFNTDVDGLGALKKANVSSAVVRAMINPHPATAAAASYAPAAPAGAGNPDDPLAAHDAGVYALSTGADGLTHMVKLDAEHPRGATHSGMFTHVVTHGIVAAKSQEVLDGAKAPVAFTAVRPVFYIYIPQYGSSFAGGININDVVLTKLDVKGDTRTSTYAAHGLFASNEVGNDQKARQGFTNEQVKPGVYRITLAGDLQPGQYAFKWTFTYYDFGILPQV